MRVCVCVLQGSRQKNNRSACKASRSGRPGSQTTHRHSVPLVWPYLFLPRQDRRTRLALSVALRQSTPHCVIYRAPPLRPSPLSTSRLPRRPPQATQPEPETELLLSSRWRAHAEGDNAGQGLPRLVIVALLQQPWTAGPPGAMCFRLDADRLEGGVVEVTQQRCSLQAPLTRGCDSVCLVRVCVPPAAATTGPWVGAVGSDRQVCSGAGKPWLRVSASYPDA